MSDTIERNAKIHPRRPHSPLPAFLKIVDEFAHHHSERRGDAGLLISAYEHVSRAIRNWPQDAQTAQKPVL